MIVPDDQPIVIVLPRFTRWMKIFSIYVAAAWVAEVLFAMLVRGADDAGPLHWLALIAERVFQRFELWRVATYPLVQPAESISSVIWAVLAFWWLGSPVEQSGGAKRVFQLALSGTLVGAIAVLIGARLSPVVMVDRATGTVPISSAFLAAWGFLFANQTVSFFGLGRMKGKHLAIGLSVISVLMAMFRLSADGLASIGGLAGGAGWMWLATRRPGRGRKAGRRTSGVSGSRFRVVQGGRDDTDPKMWN
jgi:membrane associated rhomboid family serine protease